MQQLPLGFRQGRGEEKTEMNDATCIGGEAELVEPACQQRCAVVGDHRHILLVLTLEQLASPFTKRFCTAVNGPTCSHASQAAKHGMRSSC
jgi:hypothetical protein